MDKTLAHMVRAAEAGGEELRKLFGRSLKTTRKSTAADFYTEADLRSERQILTRLRRNFPRYNILSEEHGLIDRHSRYTFVVDPLDGTNNFVLGIPNFSVAIALFDGNKVTHAVVRQPVLCETYAAVRGAGASRNGRSLRVNRERRLSHATIAYSTRYATSVKREADTLRALLGLKVKRVLTNWAPEMDFCLLAEGRLEAIVSDRNELYDFAAGKLIAEEAGAICTDYNGQPLRHDRVPTFVAGNVSAIQSAVTKAVANAVR